MTSHAFSPERRARHGFLSVTLGAAVSIFLALALVQGLTGCSGLDARQAPRVASIQTIASQAVIIDIITKDGKHGHCSGTAIAADKVLSASHCFADPVAMLLIDGAPVGVKNAVSDGADHTVVILSAPMFKTWARLAARAPALGERVMLLGNPGAFRALLRYGYVAGSDAIQPAMVPGAVADLYDITGFPGDSGGAIFDAEGDIVAIVSYARVQTADGPRIQLMGSIRFAFTAAQLAVLGLA